MTTPRSLILPNVILAFLLIPLGCAQYSLKGHVIQGQLPQILIVDANDERLTLPGLGFTKIELTLDPSSLGQKQISTAQSLPSGNFTIPVGEFGAGLLQYELAVLARRQGFRATHELFWLPPKEKRLLIILQPGKDLYVPPANPMHEAQKFLENLP